MNEVGTVGTVGNALAWHCLASRSVIDDFKGNGRWMNDVARGEARRSCSAQVKLLLR